MPEPSSKFQEILGAIAAVAPAAAGLAGILSRLIEGRVVDPEEVRRALDGARAASGAAIADLDKDHARRIVETSRALRDAAANTVDAPVALAPEALRAAEDVLQVIHDAVVATQAALLDGVRQSIAGLKAEIARVGGRADALATHVSTKVGVEVEDRLRSLEAALVASNDRVAALEALAGLGGPQPPDVVAGPAPQPPPAAEPVEMVSGPPHP